MRWTLANLPNTQQVLIHIRVIQRLPIVYVLFRYFVDQLMPVTTRVAARLLQVACETTNPAN